MPGKSRWLCGCWFIQVSNPSRSLASRSFTSVRASHASIALFSHFDETAMGRRGTASNFLVSVRALAYIAAGHALHHFAILRERYL